MTRRLARYATDPARNLTTLVVLLAATGIQRLGEAIDRAQWNDWPDSDDDWGLL